MPLKLVPGKPEEVPLMVETYFEAFSQDPIHQRFAPRGTQSARDFWTTSLSAEMRDENNHFLSVWDDSSTPKMFVGFAKWIVPGASPEPLPPADQWPSEGDQQFSVFFFGRLGEMHHEAMGKRPHWYLELVAVKPQYQGKGAASLMLKYGVNKADEDKVECFLDASPAGQPIYESRVHTRDARRESRDASVTEARDVRRETRDARVRDSPRFWKSSVGKSPKSAKTEEAHLRMMK
ncbi:hypothetical protein THARTR1_02720 [Trichoderma harzianum]|uniref:N-acetyltransferase domain-containing protein n=1 Tax=Trichoderma harzianum TaxID=5544 RepID=A0A2K0UHL3_TRIHA|nr:hypothetical protein THARTR1_02720 [Trichoderma harzianum]